MTRDINLFINEFTKEIKEGNAAIFAGAGLSVPAGFVDWKKLLEPIANELGLEIDRESDMVSLAQYHYNENGFNRSRINQLIMNGFPTSQPITENHKILSRLPISTYWTTNYDKLIEQALCSERKVPDVKYTIEHLALTKQNRDAVVYKMHGDVDHPNAAVIIKDDYESYYSKMGPFITALSGDLVSKTFLFLGLSFTDPNLDYILSRIRSTYSDSQRNHYCMLKKIEENVGEESVDFEYRKRKQELFINDLKRFNIKVLMLDSYDEITSVLKIIERKLKEKTVFISGSAHEYGEWTKEEAQKFVQLLSRRLIENEFNIVSGFGMGIGSFVVSGALEEIYMEQGNINDSQLILRPFPQDSTNGNDINELWGKYREDMLTRTGMSIFVFGNKIEKDQIVNANGVISEFDIANSKGNIVIPIGVTGYASKELWEKVKNDFNTYYPPNISNNLLDAFMELNNKDLSSEELVCKIMKFIELIILNQGSVIRYE